MDVFSLIVHVFRILLVLNPIIVLKCQVDVLHINNLSKAKSKLFSVLYLYPKGCFRCRELYPKFLQAYQAFKDDKDIYFCKVKSRKLMEKMKVTMFPSIMYFHAGEKTPDRYRGNFSVDGLIGLVQQTVQSDVSSVKRRYVVDLTMANFRTVVYITTQNTMVLVYYDEDDEMFDRFETVAEAFKSEEKVLFCRLNGNVGQELSTQFNAPDYPAIYWYAKGKVKDKKRYGGPFVVKDLIDFVNEKAGLERQKGGDLAADAGRIEALDRIVRSFVIEIFRSDNLKSFLEDAEVAAALVKDRQQYADYYVYLMEEIVEGQTSSVIYDNRANIIWKLSEEDLSMAQREDLIRKKNILDVFVQELEAPRGDNQFEIMKAYSERKQKEKERKVKARVDRKLKKEKKLKETKKISHFHEEL